MSNGIKLSGFLSHGDQNDHVVTSNGSQSGIISTFTRFSMNNGTSLINSISTSSNNQEGEVLILSSNSKAYIKDTGSNNIKLQTDNYTLSTKDHINLIYDGTNWNELSRSVAPIRYTFGGGANNHTSNFLSYESFGMYNFGPRTTALNDRDGLIERLEFVLGNDSFSGLSGNLEIRVNQALNNPTTVNSTRITPSTLISNSTTSNGQRYGSVPLSISVSDGDYLNIFCDNCNYEHLIATLIVT